MGVRLIIPSKKNPKIKEVFEDGKFIAWQVEYTFGSIGEHNKFVEKTEDAEFEIVGTIFNQNKTTALCHRLRKH